MAQDQQHRKEFSERHVLRLYLPTDEVLKPSDVFGSNYAVWVSLAHIKSSLAHIKSSISGSLASRTPCTASVSVSAVQRA